MKRADRLSETEHSSWCMGEAAMADGKMLYEHSSSFVWHRRAGPRPEVWPPNAVRIFPHTETQPPVHCAVHYKKSLAKPATKSRGRGFHRSLPAFRLHLHERVFVSYWMDGPFTASGQARTPLGQTRTELGHSLRSQERGIALRSPDDAGRPRLRAQRL